jgi:hypothetical protein
MIGTAGVDGLNRLSDAASGFARLRGRLRSMLGSSGGRRQGRWLLRVAVTAACTSLWLLAINGTASAAGVSGYRVVSAAQNVAAGQGGTASATCPSGDVVLSGGYQVSDSRPGALNYWGSAPTLATGRIQKSRTAQIRRGEGG